MKRWLAKEEIHMANIYMENYSTILEFREMLIKKKVRY